MAWHHIKHKVTGEEQFKASLAGINQDDYAVKALSRKPTEFDDVVDGKLKRNPDRETKVKETARLAGMSLTERHDDAIQKAKAELLAELKADPSILQ